MPVKSKVNISQNYVAFSEYMNFMKNHLNFESRWKLVSKYLGMYFGSLKREPMESIIYEIDCLIVFRTNKQN